MILQQAFFNPSSYQNYTQGSNTYNKPILSKYLKDLEISRKSIDTEVNEAFSNRNLLQEQFE